MMEDFSPELEAKYLHHPVVAMPSRGRNLFHATQDSTSDQLLGKPRPRSLSTGRTHKSATDVIRDLYDRIGISYDNSRDNRNGEEQREPTTIDIRHGSEINPSGADADKNLTQPPLDARGRTVDRGLKAEDEKRARSLSRGRLAQRWPPVQGGHLLSNASQPQESSETLQVNCLADNLSPKSTTSVVSPKKAYEKHISSTAFLHVGHKNAGSVTPYGDYKKPDQQNNASVAKRQSSVSAFRAEILAEPRGSQSNGREEKAHQQTAYRISVQDRIGTFDMPKTSTDLPLPRGHSASLKYASNFTKPFRAPQAGNYGKETLLKTSPSDEVEHLAEDKKEEVVFNLALPSFDSAGDSRRPHQRVETRQLIGSRPFVSGFSVAAVTAAKRFQSQHSQNTQTLNRSYVAKPIEVLEPSFANEADDLHNIDSLSTMSGEYRSSPIHTHSNDIRSNNFTDRRHSYNINMATSSLEQFKGQNQNKNDLIDKMVDERVQAHMTALEARVETQLRNLTKVMNDKVNERILALEERLNAAQGWK
jgi:hypothetical protein